MKMEKKENMQDFMGTISYLFTHQSLFQVNSGFSCTISQPYPIIYISTYLYIFIYDFLNLLKKKNPSRILVKVSLHLAPCNYNHST